MKKKIKIRSHLRRTRKGSTIIRSHLRQTKLKRPFSNPINIERQCYRCRVELTYKEFIKTNLNLNKEYLTELWENPDIELYCCDCFGMGMRKCPTNFIETKEEFFERLGDMTERLMEAKEMGKELAADVIENNLDINLEEMIQEFGEDDPESILSEISSSFQENYVQYASYSNHILPSLRQLAGFDDSGVGTYTRDSGMARVHYELEEIEERFWEGVYEKMREDFEKLYPKYLKELKK